MSTIQTPSEAIRAMLTEADLMKEFALKIKDKRGWRLSDDAAHSRVLHLLNDYGGQRGLWLDDTPIACALAGQDPVSIYFVEAAQEGEVSALRRRLVELERPRDGAREMRRVRTGSRRAEAAG